MTENTAPDATGTTTPETADGGTRVEFGIVEGRRGAQALSLRVLDPAPSVVASTIAVLCTSPFNSPASSRRRKPKGSPSFQAK